MLLAVLAAFLCLAMPLPPGAAQETQIWSASKDNTLIESPTGALSNGEGSSFFVGRTNQLRDSIRRGLLAFDIADKLPKGSKVTSVTLTLKVERTPGGSEPIELHRVLNNWGEGSSSSQGGRGAPAAKGDATWIHTFYDKDSWSKPGGDFSATASAVQTVGGVGTYTWGSTSEMVTEVQTWLDSPEGNFGWLLLGNETSPGTVKVFASRESSDSSVRPQLTVNFQPPS